jgi:hypothetical protein
MKRYPSAVATPTPTALLPDAAGPSMAMTDAGWCSVVLTARLREVGGV